MTRWSKSSVITTGQPHRAASPSIDLYTTGAPGAYATADVEPPSSRDAAWKRGMDSWPQICTGGYPWKACRKPSENQTQLDPRGARHRPPPSPRAPPSLRPARRPRRAAARAARRLSRPLVRAWRPRVPAAGGSEWDPKRSCMDGAVPWAPPGRLDLHLCRREQG